MLIRVGGWLFVVLCYCPPPPSYPPVSCCGCHCSTSSPACHTHSCIYFPCACMNPPPVFMSHRSRRAPSIARLHGPLDLDVVPPLRPSWFFYVGFHTYTAGPAWLRLSTFCSPTSVSLPPDVSLTLKACPSLSFSLLSRFLWFSLSSAVLWTMPKHGSLSPLLCFELCPNTRIL
jgi:hypothetical protein